MYTPEPHSHIGRFSWLLAAVAMIMAVIPLASAAAPSNEFLSADQVTQDIPEMSIDARDRTGTLTRDLDASGRVTVEIVHRSGADRAAIQGEVGRLNGSVLGSSPGVTLVKVPPVAVAALERRPDVEYVRSPLRVDLLPEPLDASVLPMGIGDIHVTATNAAAWQNAGYQGDGVKVGILDDFDGGVWSAAESSGDVPAPAGTFCRVGGGSCDLWTGGSRHGVAVAEIIHDMAPGAILYLATAVTVTDLSAAVAWFDSQGVQIISQSVVSQLDGPGDGTGSVDAVVDDAVSRGMIWLNAAGNHASASGTSDGGYWRGGYVDADADGWMEFAPGDEALGFYCGGIQGFRWSDWQSTGRSDYDIFITDASSVVLASSQMEQTAGAPPIEIPGSIDCGANPVLYLWVGLYSAGGGTGGDILEFMVNQAAFEYSSNPYSASGPAGDSANVGSVAVGAIDPASGGVIASYSSQGPTNDGRIKPDLSAPSCLPTVSYAPDCFNGTSAATPVAAGAAALVWGASVATTPQTVAQYLTTHVIDRGTTGPDNVYGTGQLYLGVPPANVAPVVSAGSDDAVTLPNSAVLDGTVTDDGLPSGSLSLVWTKVSGSGTVTFGDAAAVDTTAAFSVAGVYVLRLIATDGALATSDDVTITVDSIDIMILGGAGAVSASVEAQLRTCTAGSVTRLAGNNRYQTAAAISEATFASADGAYIATGLNFPDALAGGPPAAAGNQPILLVNDAVPANTLLELDRLGVSSVTVIGGPAVVPVSIAASLNALVPTTRIAGSDRYSTAAAIVQAKFASADTVYVATGLNFPDALAGVPAAAGDAAPILLVQQNFVPGATIAQLNRLKPTTIKILGGEAVISPVVANTLGGYASTVIRLAGSDRYSTATAISRHAFPSGVSRIYVATGLNYPDALAGGPAAGVNSAPILLVQTDSIPSSTKTEIERITGTACW